MFCMKHISGRLPNTRVHDVSITVKDAQVQAVICPNINTIDEFIYILHEDNSLKKGSMILDGEKYERMKAEDKIAFITKKKHLYPNLSVADNIIMSTEKMPFFLSKKKYYQECKELLKEVDYSLDIKTKVRNLNPEERMMVSILKAIAVKPRLLVIDELHGKLSYKGMTCFFRILDMLKSKGAMILYFTSQWEDSVKMGDEITVISHGKTFGEYSVKEIEKNPTKIYYVMMGGDKVKNEEKQREFLQALSQGVGELRTGYNQGNAMKELAKRITKEVKGTYCNICLIDEKNESFMEIADDECSDIPKIKREKFQLLNEKEGFYYLSINEDRQFLEWFEKDDPKGIAAVLGIPIKSNGENAGIIQVYYKDYYIYSEEDRLYLELIAREVAMLIENSKLRGRSVLLQESHHRIKNNLQVIVSLLQMEKIMLKNKLCSQKNLEEISLMLDGVIGRIKSIATIHNILAHDSSISQVTSMEEIIEEIKKFYNQSAVIKIQTEKVFVPYNRATSLALVLNELINNSIKHAEEPLPEITLHIRRDIKREKIIMEYRDNGLGFPPEFEPENQTGIGLMVIRSIVCQELEGKVEFKNKNGAYITMEIGKDKFF